jgi:hypothetical protein
VSMPFFMYSSSVIILTISSCELKIQASGHITRRSVKRKGQNRENQGQRLTSNEPRNIIEPMSGGAPLEQFLLDFVTVAPSSRWNNVKRHPESTTGGTETHKDNRATTSTWSSTHPCLTTRTPSSQTFRERRESKRTEERVGEK